MDDNELSYEQLKPFACKECPNSFTTKHSLRIHTKTIHSKGTFECSKCDFKCERMGKMTFHMQRHLQQERHPKRSDEYEVQAKIPSIVIKLGNNKLYINHNNVTESQEIQKPLPKNELERRFKEQNQLKLNKTIHRSSGNFSCEICKKRFTRRVRFQKHMIIKHTNIKSIQQGSKLDGKHLRCLICHKRFSGKGILKRHMLNHTGEKPFECTKCEAKFHQKIKLHQHMMKYHENRPFRCTKCNESFAQCIQLQDHMATHTATKEYMCKKCDKSFAIRRELKRHMLLSHIKNDPLQSKKPANKLILKRSVSKSTKKNHTTININITVNSEKSTPPEKSFKCMKCQEYVKVSELREHMDMHQNAFRCEDCNRIFLSQHSLKIHKAKVHRENDMHTDLDIESENRNSIKKDVLGHSLRSQNINITKDQNKLIDYTKLDLDSEYKTNLNYENTTNISPIVNDKKTIRCEICHRVFNTIRSINIHKARVHKAYNNQTDLVFEEENKNTLNEEESNNTPFIKKEKEQIDLKCNVCDKIFHSLRSINIHKGKAHKKLINKKHSDIEDNKNTLTEEDRGYIYSNDSDIEDNKNTLSEEDGGYHSYIDQDPSDFKCEICDKTFHSMPSVNIHKSRAHKDYYPNVILRRLPEMKCETPEIKCETEKYLNENMESDFGNQKDNSELNETETDKKENIESSSGNNLANSGLSEMETSQKENMESNLANDLDISDISDTEDYQKEYKESNLANDLDLSDLSEDENDQKENKESILINDLDISDLSEDENDQKENKESSFGNQIDNSYLDDLKPESKEWAIKSYEVGSKLKIKLLTSSIER